MTVVEPLNLIPEMIRQAQIDVKRRTPIKCGDHDGRDCARALLHRMKTVLEKDHDVLDIALEIVGEINA